MTDVIEKPEATQDLEDEDARAKRAMEWCIAQSEGGICLFCGGDFTGVARNGLGGHLRQKHGFRMVEAFLANDANISMKAEIDDPILAAGFEVTDDYDYKQQSPLRISEAMQEKKDKEGGRFYWAAERNLGRYKDWGMEFVTQDEQGRVNTNSVVDAEGRVRSNEMTLMYQPPRLHEARQQHKRQQINDQIKGKLEDRQSQQVAESKVRGVYDEAMKRGRSKEQAQNMARSVEQGLLNGTITIKRGSG